MLFNTSKWIKIEYYSTTFIGAFEKLRKATIDFVMSVCPSVSPYIRMERLRFNEANFHEF